ncbi:GPI ethanolamine phosphate transferase 2-like [Diadema setosum]|uniref:GPI ethanolamine phosphate transferase 2-like n=1 Tax=Diadema setosum TaxID=31175 RepID=UPI003B3BD9B1
MAPPIPPKFGQLVIMLIDGFRADFVLGDRGPTLMPYTRELIDKGETKSFVAKAHVPTVTMPRIKAITTGTVPGFIDFVINLDSKAIHEDNILLQMYLSQKRIHLYGDDTWLRMFPGHFHKSDGTTSFFVTDYTEVDNNVTRNVEPALKSPDWDTIILHYLGLDHIGHLGGPYSPLVQPKLKEMDLMVKTIHQTLVQQDLENTLPSLLVLCGDHGMSEGGSHGGASQGEVLTPLIFISSAYSGGRGMLETNHQVQQIDFAPTISLLLGHPIPQNSLGCVIPQALDGSLAMQEQLRALQLNGYQLMAVHQINSGRVDEDAKLQLMQAVRLHAKWLQVETGVTSQVHRDLGERAVEQYMKALHTMRDRIMASLSQYDMHAIISGILLLWVVFFILILEMASSQANRPSSHLTNMGAVFTVCCLVTGVVQVGLCGGVGGTHRDVLCSSSGTSVFLLVGFVATFGFVASLVVSSPPMVYTHLITMSKRPTQTGTEIFFILGSVLHTYSLASSSFVEEEHQTWYFLTTTLMLGVCVSGCVSWQPSLAGGALACAVLLRLLRVWNQTGVEWINEPDIGDWFVRPENKMYLTVLLVISLTIIYMVTTLDRGRQQPFLAASLVGTLLYRNAVGTVALPITLPSSPNGILEAWFTYAVITLSLVVSLVKCGRIFVLSPLPPRTHADYLRGYLDSAAQPPSESDVASIPALLLRDFHTALTMLAALILRPHNSAVLAILVLLQYAVHGYLLPRLQWKLWVVTLLHVWMGQAAFYGQGNSNNAATMDISAGYVGLEGYNLMLASGLTFIATYSGPLLWLTRLAVYVVTQHLDRLSSAVEESCFTMALSRALPVASYTVLATVQRYHLFVWSVFSPKLLYDGVHTSLVCVSILVSVLFCVLLERVGILRTFKSDLHSR